MRNQKNHDIIVIGAGAAGLLAAGRAAELGAKVLLLERMKQPGRKLLITGKGRCNISNQNGLSEFLNHVYPNNRFLRPAFSHFFNSDMIVLLNTMGVETVVERGERIFPKSNKASDVVDALVKWNQKNKVEISTGARVMELLVKDNQLNGVKAEINGHVQEIQAPNVIICTGGKSYPATGSSGDGYKLAESVGHSITPLRPSLVPLETEGPYASALQGLALKNVSAVVWINGKKAAEDFGEMLFTHFGLSGPIILTLSRIVSASLSSGNKIELSIDLKPALDEEKLDKRIIRDLNENGKRQLSNLFRLWLPMSLVPVFIDILGIDPSLEAHQLKAPERKKIIRLMKDFRFKVSGVRSFKEAIVTAGGIPTDEINPKTMESKKMKNLYFAGEVIDLDADTGGYNLQIAWSTGWLAGSASWQS
jgi:predicted Rossmann fold flavoprotein